MRAFWFHSHYQSHTWQNILHTRMQSQPATGPLASPRHIRTWNKPVCVADMLFLFTDANTKQVPGSQITRMYPLCPTRVSSLPPFSLTVLGCCEIAALCSHWCVHSTWPAISNHRGTAGEKVPSCSPPPTPLRPGGEDRGPEWVQSTGSLLVLRGGPGHPAPTRPQTRWPHVAPELRPPGFWIVSRTASPQGTFKRSRRTQEFPKKQ